MVDRMTISKIKTYFNNLYSEPERIVGLVLLAVVLAAVYGVVTIPNRSGAPHLERKELRDEQQRQDIIERYKEQGL